MSEHAVSNVAVAFFALVLDGRERAEAPAGFRAIPPGPVLLTSSWARMFNGGGTVVQSDSAEAMLRLMATGTGYWEETYELEKLLDYKGWKAGRAVVNPTKTYLAVRAEAISDGETLTVHPVGVPSRGPSILRLLKATTSDNQA